MKRTYQPSVTKRKRTHGFLVHSKTRGGRVALAARRAKDRKHLAVQFWTTALAGSTAY